MSKPALRLIERHLKRTNRHSTVRAVIIAEFSMHLFAIVRNEFPFQFSIIR